MWQLNTLGRERRLLQGPPTPDFLPSWLNPPLFMLSLFSSAVMIVKVVDVICAGIGKPLGLFVWYASIQFALIMVLWFFGPWGSDRYSVVLLPPLIVILANSQLRSKIALASIGVLFALSMLVTWNETQTSRAIAEALAWLRGKNIPFATLMRDTCSTVGTSMPTQKIYRPALCLREMFLSSHQRRTNLT